MKLLLSIEKKLQEKKEEEKNRGTVASVSGVFIKVPVVLCFSSGCYTIDLVRLIPANQKLSKIYARFVKICKAQSSALLINWRQFG